MFNVTKKSIQWGGETLTLETGKVARQADGSVIATLGETSVMANVTFAKAPKPGQDFFPLTVHYQEKYYAAGKIPGGFFKREARPSEKETLVSRLIDRPCRPLFVEGFKHEVLVMATVLSCDLHNDPDIVAMIAASAALTISGVPFMGPIGAARVGFVDGKYVLNPAMDDMTQLRLKPEQRLDLVVAGTKDAVMMVESEAYELTEEEMLGAVVFGHEQMQPVIDLILDLAEDAANEPFDFTPPDLSAIYAKVKAAGEAQMRAAFAIRDKQDRTNAISAAVDAIKGALSDEDLKDINLGSAIKKLESSILRGDVVNTGARIDGRDTKTVRPIVCETGILPRTHGSALFTRGETQALVITTLGTERDAQRIDALAGEFEDRFMFHYNMPPFATGEVGRMGSTKRREIGHGRLAKRALAAVLPTKEEFPYTVRVVSEITESNGSSSMASVCGGCLSMMDAGVPMKAHVAGIAMGLIKEDNRFAVLTDILGDEDHLGDMDFKVAGTTFGITALQMDIKITGVTFDILKDALTQAKEARLNILGQMDAVISSPSEEMSPYAPRIIQVQIDPSQIGMLIGKGGETIRGLAEEFESQIDVNDEGQVLIYSSNGELGEALRDRITTMMKEVEVGDEFTGKVVKTTTFGAFIELAKGTDGLLHISNVSPGERVENVDDVLSRGDEIQVRVVEVDRERGRIGLRLSDDPSIAGKSADELAAATSGGGGGGQRRERSGGDGGGSDRPRHRRGGRDRD